LNGLRVGGKVIALPESSKQRLGKLIMTEDLTPLLDQLNDFDPEVRAEALAELQSMDISRKSLKQPHVNMHCHTFHSYNGYGSSPSRLAWEAWAKSWYGIATCDFDVLDSVPEFLEAADKISIRAAAHMETRVFFKEYADQVINSPGEPGIFYFMGSGFTELPAEDSEDAQKIAALKTTAQARNQTVIGLLNSFLGETVIDYAEHILPMTPTGNPTERHIVQALDEQIAATKGSGATAFWADKLGLDSNAVASAQTDTNGFRDLLRSKLMKSGGPAYIQPDPASFPALEDMISLFKSCEAIPTAAWLDGTSEGESNPTEQLECLKAKGVAAVNIIPDRNWNIDDPDERNRKIENFHAYVQAADKLHMPINVGTELNKPGQRWMDEFTAEPMARVAPSLIRGAEIMIGHTRLSRFAGVTYCGAKAEAEFGTNIDLKNRVFAAIGALPPFQPAVVGYLKRMEPEHNYAYMRESIKDRL